MKSQKFIEAHPGVLRDIAGFCRLLHGSAFCSQQALRQSGRVAHRCEGDTRTFPRLTERAQEPEPQPVQKPAPVQFLCRH